MLPFSFIVTTILFPQTALILSPRRKSKDNLKLNDDGSQLKALKKEKKEKHHILTVLEVIVESLPRQPRRGVGKWAFGILWEHRAPQNIIVSYGILC